MSRHVIFLLQKTDIVVLSLVILLNRTSEARFFFGEIYR
jgi:hypothetical protein